MKQISVCTGLDREKYSTLHTCGTKILPCEEDGVVVVLVVVGVVPLLRVGPSAHLLQAARWVATLDQAYRLQEHTKAEIPLRTLNLQLNVIAHPFESQCKSYFCREFVGGVFTLNNALKFFFKLKTKNKKQNKTRPKNCNSRGKKNPQNTQNIFMLYQLTFS